MALDLAVLVSGGARDQRVGARAHVRLLLAVCFGDPTQVEAGCDGLPDCAVSVQLCGFRLDAVFAFFRIRVLRDLGMVLQCGFQCLTFVPFL